MRHSQLARLTKARTHDRSAIAAIMGALERLDQETKDNP
jgi:hypothetical protein